jgi:uncharacterized membrane protein YphA (DoxX/SURF4 family)
MTTAAQSTSSATHSKALHIGLWIAQALLAFAFVSAGAMKSTQPIAKLAEMMVWPGAIPEGLVRFIGVSEFLGGVGLILPAITRIKPILTPLAGVGLATIQALAIFFHLSRGEYGALPFNLTLGALAAFVAWGRLKKAPIR